MSAFVFMLCLLSYGFAHYYIPPSPAYRLWPDLSPSTATVAAVVGINVAVCLAWRWTPFWPFMTRYFMHVPGYPRAVQSIANVFSHIQYEHLFGNMLTFGLLVGPVCHDLVGRGIFLGTYMSAGAIGSLFTLYWANLGRGNISAHSVGASAALWGIAALYCFTTDQEIIKVPFVKDLEVMFWPKMLCGFFIALEIMTIYKTKGRGTQDHASHVGGMLTGLSVAGYLRATGWTEWRKQQQDKAVEGGDKVEKTVDVEAIVKDEVKEVQEQVKKIVK
jgi:rhomboid-like protein